MITQIDIININHVTIDIIWGNKPADYVNMKLTELRQDGKITNPPYKSIIVDAIHEHIKMLMRTYNKSLEIV